MVSDSEAINLSFHFPSRGIFANAVQSRLMAFMQIKLVDILNSDIDIPRLFFNIKNIEKLNL